jgi:hypothetical protein
MLFQDKLLEDVTESDLLRLVGLAREVKTLEFKRTLPSDTEKVELLADISSFANASGGHIIYGMDAKDGIASSLVGFDASSIDDVKLRLESSVAANLKPRLLNFNLKEVKLESGKYSIIAQIPKSWLAPHVVEYQHHWRFYSRNSAGKYRLDVDEVRNAFLATETLREQVRSFRAERLANVVAGETPIYLADIPKIVLHMIPFSAFNRESLTIRQIGYDDKLNRYFGGTQRYNLDGYLSYRSNSNGHNEYKQLFRNGILEFARAWKMTTHPDGRLLIPSTTFEQMLMQEMQDILLIYKSLGIEPPVMISLALLGVKNYYMGVTNFAERRFDNIHYIDRDNLILPEIVLQDLSQEPHTILRPLFDAVWNACGWYGSLNYDENGDWRQHP